MWTQLSRKLLERSELLLWTVEWRKQGGGGQDAAEAIGPSRVKHWADEASLKRRRGSFECASAIFKVIIDFAAKFPPVRASAYEYIVVPVYTYAYIPRDEFALKTSYCHYFYEGEHSFKNFTMTSKCGKN